MSDHRLVVALGGRRYRVERPFGDLPSDAGRVSDVTVDSRGHVFVLLRYDPLVDTPGTPVVELDRDGKRVNAWGADLIADSHMIACTRRRPALHRRPRRARDRHLLDGRASASAASAGGIARSSRSIIRPTWRSRRPATSSCRTATRPARFTASGAMAPRIKSWGSWGRDRGEFINSHAIWVLPDGRVVAVDRENERLQVFSADGALLDIWGGFKQPLDIWGDADGNMFVTDLVPSLTMLSSDGKVLGRCRPVLNGAHGIWGDADGNLFLAEPNPSRITKLAPE